MSFQKTTQQGLTQAPGKDLVSLSDSKNGFCSILGTSPTNQAWVLLAAVASPPRNPDSIRCILLIIVCLPVRMQLQKTEATLALFCRLRPKIHILVIEDPARLCPITAFPRASVRPVCLVSQSCPTLCDPMDCSPPGSTVHVILQARILEWVAIVFSRGSSQPRDRTCASVSPAPTGGFFTTAPPGKPLLGPDRRREWGQDPAEPPTISCVCPCAPNPFPWVCSIPGGPWLCGINRFLQPEL